MPSSESIEQKSRIVDLLEIYGGLLTDRQRSLIQQHYAEDLSYGEISESLGISRQAVHDAIGHGKKSLERYEACLHLLAQPTEPEKETSGVSFAQTEEHVLQEARRLVKKARNMVGDDLLYDTSKLKRLLNQLAEVLDRGV